MLFDLDKCSVMHFGFANEGMEVRLGDKVLGAQKSERDLGVIMQSDLKVDKQCSKAANEANKWLGMISRNFKCKAKKVHCTAACTLITACRHGDCTTGRIKISWRRCRGERPGW